MEETPDDILMIEPPPFLSIAGRNALMVRCMDLTLRSKEKSQSFSEHSSAVPWCTWPATLTRISGAPNSLMVAFANASTFFVESTSSLADLAVFRPLSLSAATSVAMTLAPSAMNASAIARPMPWPAAVTSANFPFSLSLTILPSSMVVARDAFLCDTLIFDRRFKHHAFVQLVDDAALDVLPRGLTCRVVIAAILEQSGLASR